MCVDLSESKSVCVCVLLLLFLLCMLSGQCEFSTLFMWSWSFNLRFDVFSFSWTNEPKTHRQFHHKKAATHFWCYDSEKACVQIVNLLIRHNIEHFQYTMAYLLHAYIAQETEKKQTIVIFINARIIFSVVFFFVLLLLLVIIFSFICHISISPKSVNKLLK